MGWAMRPSLANARRAESHPFFPQVGNVGRQVLQNQKYVRWMGLLMVFLLCQGCGSGLREDPILRLGAEESLAQGKALMAEGKYRLARKYLLHTFEVEPNSPMGREGLLLAADSLFKEDTLSGYIEAESRYRDFLNRFPTSDQAGYAQFQIAKCLAERMEKPNRDQSTTHKAMAEFQEVLRLYPTTPYAGEAREQIVRVKDRLAEHEFVVGNFYLRYGIPRAAVNRFEKLLEEYPSYTGKDKLLFFLCRAYEENEQPENAAKTCDRLRQEFPDSRYSAKLPKEAPGDAQNKDSTPDLAVDGGL